MLLIRYNWKTHVIFCSFCSCLDWTGFTQAFTLHEKNSPSHLLREDGALHSGDLHQRGALTKLCIIGWKKKLKHVNLAFILPVTGEYRHNATEKYNSL